MLVSMLILTLPAAASDWGWSLGLHDFVVPDESSHTPGIGAGLFVEHAFPSGMIFNGSFDLFVDYDTDELDPDHIPVWWQTELALKKSFADASPSTKLSWVIDATAKRNTASTLEFNTDAMAGVVVDYDGGALDASLKGLLGHYRLEMDDDLPAERGYSRDDLIVSTGAYSIGAEVGFDLGAKTRLSARAQQWASDERWLERQAEVGLTHGMSIGGRAGTLVVSGEYFEYNLDNFSPSMTTQGSEPLPILPWDDDLLVRVYFEMPF
jgi:hypothetical protein